MKIVIIFSTDSLLIETIRGAYQLSDQTKVVDYSDFESNRYVIKDLSPDKILIDKETISFEVIGETIDGFKFELINRPIIVADFFNKSN